MRAVILVGQGSPEVGTGGALIRLAARVRAAGIAPLAAACFLDHGRPSFAEALDQCVARGADEMIVIPYALALTGHDRLVLAQLADVAHERHPNLILRITRAIGDHPALAQVLMQRASEADYLAAHPWLLHQDALIWPGWQMSQAVNLLIVLDDASILPRIIPEEAIRRCSQGSRYANVQLCYIHAGEPRLDAAIDALAQRREHSVIIAPYTLERQSPFLPAIEATIAAARGRYPALTIIQAEHLAYDRRLLEAIAEQVDQQNAGDA